MSNEIRSAIKQSKTHDEIVYVAVDCTTATLRALLASMIDCDWDMCEIDDDKVHVWGWTRDTPEDQAEFRLIVQCQPEQVEA